ncbi:MAG: phytoene desaturase family protein [Hyphococcus sp.]
MADNTDNPPTGRIEGGIDAVVVGAGADGLAAAAYLGQGGLRTVLLEGSVEIGAEIRRREFAPGAHCVDGEHLVAMLDPDAIADLDLYRHGVAYAARRLDTTYFFADGRSLDLDGDIMNAAATLDEEVGGGTAFQTFAQHVMETGAALRPAFEAARFDARPRRRGAVKAADGAGDEARLQDYLLSSGAAVLDAYLPDGALKTALMNEIAFRAAAAPHEAFSFMSLVRRWAGESSGLQGAIAYPKGGAVAVINALRRAVQAAKVEIRAATPVRRILIERDCVAGVELVNGGQVRAPIVVAAMDARRVFVDMIGPAGLDIEFSRTLTAYAPSIASARLHVLLKGLARDEKTRARMRRRLVYAPSADRLRRAFADARRGDVPSDLMIEAIFPEALEDDTDGDAQLILSAIAHPLPFDETPDAARKEAVKQAILANLDAFAPEIEDRIEAADLRLPDDLAGTAGGYAAAYASKPGVLRQFARADALTAAGGIDGLYFCGPEAQIGQGLSCAAGRVAAKAALRHAKRGVIAA